LAQIGISFLLTRYTGLAQWTGLLHWTGHRCGSDRDLSPLKLGYRAPSLDRTQVMNSKGFSLLRHAALSLSKQSSDEGLRGILSSPSGIQGSSFDRNQEQD
jgi:hypothetical protein